MLNLILLISGQNLDEGAKVAEATVQQEGAMKGLFSSIMNGGPIIIPIVILSLIAVFIFLERYIAIYRAGRTDSGLMSKLREHIIEGKIDLASSLCQVKNTPITRMIGKGISRIGRSLSDVNVTIENVASLEVSKLEKRLPFLASIVGGAPMLGILGTIIGILQAFYEMSTSGTTIDMTLIFTSVYHTLGTTVLGFIVGVIAYFAYNILVASVDGVILKFKTANSEFMDMLNDMVA
jgi:biopolymer transport protein ExbB